MSEPSLVDVFGSKVKQDGLKLEIYKTDLEEVGLTPADVNTAEGCFTAILLKAQKTLNSGAQTSVNKDIQITIAEDFSNIVTRDGKQYKEFTYTVKLQKEDNQSTVNPNDF